MVHQCSGEAKYRPTTATRLAGQAKFLLSQAEIPAVTIPPAGPGFLIMDPARRQKGPLNSLPSSKTERFGAENQNFEFSTQSSRRDSGRTI